MISAGLRVLARFLVAGITDPSHNWGRSSLLQKIRKDFSRGFETSRV